MYAVQKNCTMTLNPAPANLDRAPDAAANPARTQAACPDTATLARMFRLYCAA